VERPLRAPFASFRGASASSPTVLPAGGIPKGQPPPTGPAVGLEKGLYFGPERRHIGVDEKPGADIRQRPPAGTLPPALENRSRPTPIN
jgi:hypothetical protein